MKIRILGLVATVLCSACTDVEDCSPEGVWTVTFSLTSTPSADCEGLQSSSIAQAFTVTSDGTVSLNDTTCTPFSSTPGVCELSGTYFCGDSQYQVDLTVDSLGSIAGTLTVSYDNGAGITCTDQYNASGTKS